MIERVVVSGLAAMLLAGLCVSGCQKGPMQKTGEKVDVPPKKIPYFKMGKELKALLNSVAGEEAQATASEQ